MTQSSMMIELKCFKELQYFLRRHGSESKIEVDIPLHHKVLSKMLPRLVDIVSHLTG